MLQPGQQHAECQPGYPRQRDGQALSLSLPQPALRGVSIEVQPGVKLNGDLTLGENLADMGGLKMAFRAFLRELDETGVHPDDTAGHHLTHRQLFFTAFAQVWCGHARPEAEKQQALAPIRSVREAACGSRRLTPHSCPGRCSRTRIRCREPESTRPSPISRRSARRSTAKPGPR